MVERRDENPPTRQDERQTAQEVVTCVALCTSSEAQGSLRAVDVRVIGFVPLFGGFWTMTVPLFVNVVGH